jgi:hypothetical protein
METLLGLSSGSGKNWMPSRGDEYTRGLLCDGGVLRNGFNFWRKGGCNHIKAACKPDFGMNVEDIKKPSKDVFHVARRFFTLIWDKGGSQVVAVEVEAYMMKVWLLEFMPSCRPSPLFLHADI